MIYRLIRRPLRTSTKLALSLAAIIVTLGLIIGGAYAMTAHTLNVAQQNHKNSDEQQAKASLQAAKRECQALTALGDSGNGVDFGHVNAAHPAELTLTRMLRNINKVVVDSGCPYILKGEFPPGEKPS